MIQSSVHSTTLHSTVGQAAGLEVGCGCEAGREVYERTLRAREEAAAVLGELMAAHAECDQRLKAAGRRVDSVKAVTGRSAIESAIEETRRMIAGIDRTLEELRREESMGGMSDRVMSRGLAW